jgi:beta-N-acetylhexosaminidase
MPKIRQNFFIILLVIATLLLGYNYFYRPFEKALINPNEMLKAQTPEETKNTPEFILSSLTPEERVAQLIATPVDVNAYFSQAEKLDGEILDVNEEIRDIIDIAKKTGFYTLFGTKISQSQAQKVISELKDNYFVSRLRPMVAVDHEGGSVQRLSGEGFTKLDSWRDVCNQETVDRRANIKQSANELRKVGVDIVLAPVLDVGNNPNLKDRICSKDNYAIVADRSMDYVTIFSNVGILPVVKHFPGIGQTKKDLHKDFESISVLEYDTRLYKFILDQNEKIGIMIAHVGVTSQDAEIPCSVSPYCVSELNKAYPNILVFTDALEMKAALYDKDNPNVPKSLVQVSGEAILAGNNVLLYGQSVTQEEISEIITELTREYETNEQLKSLVDKSVLKIIKYKTI